MKTHRHHCWIVPCVLSIIAGFSAGEAHGENPFAFRDVGNEAGLFPHVAGIAGHAVAWGDADGNGFPDLYVATFGGHPYGSKFNQFFRNDKGKFRFDDQPVLAVNGRASGAVFADFDNDGDLDLYLSNHAILAADQPHYQAPNYLFRNDGGGKFTDVSEASGARPPTFPDGSVFAGRSAAVLDFDGDGLLDLLVGECRFQGGKGRSKLYRNLGNLRFEDVTQAAGLPAEKCTGLGVAAGDLTGDGWPDIFLAGRDGGTRLFINDGKGRFREVPNSHADFTWEYKDTPDDTTCGVCFGDVNGDGLPDILIGSHFDRPWWTGGVPVRLYLNRGMSDGIPRFEDVTEAAGLVPLPMKSPHVEIQDFDNDGRPDIYTSIVKFADGKPHPVIFHNEGIRDGLPRFREHTLAVNDFPTEEDRKMANVGPFFEKMQRENKIVYTAPGPSADFDRDGRLDLFLANWWVDERSLLLRNESKAGNWLRVAVVGNNGVNRTGIGAVVHVFPVGKTGDRVARLGSQEISAGYGYASGQEAIAHFGLGDVEKCDVVIILPHGKGQLERRGVEANQHLTLTVPALGD